MSLKNIKSNAQDQKGFTIVELLIVVVVIAILAAITIVSYNGITNRANASAAQSTAASLQKKIELFASDGPSSTYPRTISDLTGAAAISQVTPTTTTTSANTWYIAPGSLNVTAAPATDPTTSNGKNTVRFEPCGSGTGAATASTFVPTGANIKWYNFQDNTIKTITVGTIGSYCPATY
jgi:type IV pilus assembly protein PilA